jgi:hypothetical protein
LPKDWLRRACAGLIALTAVVGLVVQLDATFANARSLAASLWILLRYFTILANVLVAVVFAMEAFDQPRPRHAWLMGGAVYLIVLVGVIYGLLLRGLLELSGGAALADLLLHTVTPLIAPIYWLVFAAKGGLRYRHVLIWAAAAVAYVIYALVRGHFEGLHAYPFIDLAKIGAARTAINCLAIGAVFLPIGCAFVWVDHALARKPARAA